MKKFHYDAERYKLVICFLKILSILYWLALLSTADSYYIPYLIVGSCGIISVYINMDEKENFIKKEENFVVLAFSCLLSLMVASANYGIFTDNNVPENINIYFFGLYQKSLFILLFIGGFFAFKNLFIYLANRLRNYYWHKKVRLGYGWKVTSIYCISMFITSAANIFIMYNCYYPGNLTSDSVYVIKQALYGPYSNQHPYYYTKIIEFFLVNGKQWFHNINAAVAFFSIFQIIFMAACISYVIVTLYQMEVSWKLVLGCLIWYIIMPFHIMYSFSMWKDVMFGGFVAVYIVAVFRIWKKIGKYNYVNWFMMMIGGSGTCLFRSNGWFAFFLSFLCFIFLFGEDANKKKMILYLGGILGLTLILKYPVLYTLDVRQPDIVEKLSVPIQQIARIIRDCDDVREEHKVLLRKIVDVDQISEAYKPYISDPIKDLIREGDKQYLEDHKAVYLKLYLEMSLSHLDKSVEAWIDLTKGYWNGGYSRWKWLDCVEGKEELGLERTIHMKNLKGVLDGYFWMYDSNSFLKIFLCIGFHTWIIMLLAVLSILRKDKESFFMTIPLISIIFTLLITTPVYAEFRYIYAVFCCIPFIIVATFFKGNLGITT